METVTPYWLGSLSLEWSKCALNVNSSLLLVTVLDGGWGAWMRGHPPAELPSLCIRKAKRESWACLSGCLLLCLRAGLQWKCLALGKEEAPRATVAGGAALLPCRREAGPSAEVLWESCCGVRTGVCPWSFPGSLVLCLSQPHGFPPSCLGVQGPEPRGHRHHCDHLSPPRPGLCDERAGHLEEVGGWSRPG